MTISCYLSLNLIEMDQFSFLKKSNSCWPPDTSSEVHIISDFSEKRWKDSLCHTSLHMVCYFTIDLMKYMTAYMTSSKWHMQILDILSIGFFLSLLFDNQFLAEYWRPIFQVGRFLPLCTPSLGPFFSLQHFLIFQRFIYALTKIIKKMDCNLLVKREQSF